MAKPKPLPPVRPKPRPTVTPKPPQRQKPPAELKAATRLITNHASRGRRGPAGRNNKK